MRDQPVEQLAIAKGVGVGVRDAGRPILWFEVSMLYGGALLVFEWDEARQLIQDADAYDIKSLEGRACVVTSGGPGSVVRFIRWHK